MAGSEDDIEKLLREVEGTLGGPRAGSTNAPVPATRSGQPNRLQRALPPALLVGAASGASVGVLFAVIPFVGSISGGAGAFLAGFTVSLVGRVRRG